MVRKKGKMIIPAPARLAESDTFRPAGLGSETLPLEVEELLSLLHQIATGVSFKIALPVPVSKSQ